MAIAKKPKRNTGAAAAVDSEKAADSFIAGAGSVPIEPPADTRKVPVMIRFDRDLLRRVDEAARRRGISRSAWVRYMLSEAVGED